MKKSYREKIAEIASSPPGAEIERVVQIEASSPPDEVTYVYYLTNRGRIFFEENNNGIIQEINGPDLSESPLDK